jgi:hypothetical protein
MTSTMSTIRDLRLWGRRGVDKETNFLYIQFVLKVTIWRN